MLGQSSIGEFSLGETSPAVTTTLDTTAGALALTGKSATFLVTQATTQAALTLTGQSATEPITVATAQAALTLTGQSAGLNVTQATTEAHLRLIQPVIARGGLLGFGALGEAALGEAEGGAESATFLITQATAKGDLTLTGQSVGLNVNFPVLPGTLTLTGEEPASVILPVTSTALTLTGKSAALNATFATASAALTLTPFQATLLAIGGGSDSDDRRHHKRRDPDAPPLRHRDRKITITDQDGKTRKVSLIRRFEPPPSFQYPPDWAVPQITRVAPIKRQPPMAPLAGPLAASLPTSLLALHELRDEDDMVAIGLALTTPDPMIEDMIVLLAALAESGALDRMMEA